jgi:HAMP domain-containing protein
MENKNFFSLQVKLTLSFVLIVCVISLLTFFYTFSQTKKVIKEIVRTELTAMASLIASQLNGVDADAFSKLEVGEEKSPQYLYIQEKLRRFALSHPDIKYLYSMRKVGDDVVFIVDPDYGIKDDAVKIGEKYDAKNEILMKGFQMPIAEQDYTTDKWGSLLSGYAPIKNSRGDVVGLIGVDMLNSLVLKKQQFIGTTIFFIMGIGILIASLIVFIFSKTIIRDINKLNEIAEAISMGNITVALNIKRNDEIGTLAKSFKRMVASLKVLMQKDS